jgi:enamine deaminase RidA (YjgF/YER057c/UK114 family)
MGSHAVQAGGFIFVGGQLASDYQHGLAPEVDTPRAARNPVVAGKLQSEYILNSTEAILKAAGSSLQHGVRIDQFVSRPDVASPYLEVRARHIDPAIRPASTHIQLQEFLVPKCTVTLQLIAVPASGAPTKEMLYVEGVAQSPGGPFKAGAQGVKAGDFVFVTGQVASDLKTGVAPEARTNPAFWYGSPIKLQTGFVLNQTAKILQAAGSSLGSVLKADVYLTNMADVYELDEVWRLHFPMDPPARTIIPATRLAPIDCLVEITTIAVTDRGAARKETVVAKDVEPPGLHHPHAVRADNFVFLSGQYATESWEGIAPQAGRHPEMPWFGSSAAQQTEHIIERMARICRAAGTRIENMVWTQALYTDLRDFQPSLDVWEQRFSRDAPACFAAGVASPHAVPDCSILMDGVAIILE